MNSVAGRFSSLKESQRVIWGGDVTAVSPENDSGSSRGYGGLSALDNQSNVVIKDVCVEGFRTKLGAEPQINQSICGFYLVELGIERLLLHGSLVL